MPDEKVKNFLKATLPFGMLFGAGFFLVLVWFKTEGFPGITDQGEPFYQYLVAKNFLQYGLLENSFLEDHATSPDPQAHPYYYTHNPNFTKFLIYFFLKLGLTDMRWYIFLAIPLFLLGQWYFYKMSSEALGKATGLLTLLFASTGYILSLSWGFNIIRVWTWILICGAIYHLLKMERLQNQLQQRGHTILFYFWLALLSYYQYDILFYFTLVVFVMKYLQLISWSWKRFFLTWLAIPGSLFVFHQLCIIHELGVALWFQDWVYTIGNRTFGVPSKAVLQAFYDRFGLVLWGYHNTFGLKYISRLLWESLCQHIGIFPTFLTLLGFVGVPLLALQKKWCPPPGCKFLAAMALGTILFFVASPYHFHVLYSPSTARFPFLIFFVYPFFAFVILFLKNLWTQTRGKMAHQWGVALALFLILVPYAQAQYKNFLKTPPRKIPAAEVLPKYRGHTFFSNYYPPYIHYFTQNWAYFQQGSDTFIFERDKLQNPQKYLQPDYVLCVGPCPIEQLTKVIEKGFNWKIADLRAKAPPLVSPAFDWSTSGDGTSGGEGVQ